MNTYIDQELGSVRRAAQLTQIGFDPQSFNSSRLSRIDDLTVYFALNLFNRRQPYTQLPKELQRDVNVFFQSYRVAQDLGRDLLFSVGEPETIYNACLEASEHNIGFLDGTHSLQLHSDLVEKLPAPLRTYVGCAEKLYGDVDQADLVKIHILSGKVTFLEYESFEKSAIPQLILRTKVNLREREVDYFYYQDAVNSQLLYQKSKYMAEGQVGYETQRRFDQRLNKLGLIDFEGFGYSMAEGMAAGIPVNASRVGAIPELIEDGISGVLIEPNNIVRWQKSLENLVSDASRREIIGAGGKKRIEKEFSAKKMSQLYFDYVTAY